MKNILKNQKIENENGRSMIEMLGVLAIIGVLSVGGIAGFSKAMHRYRVNKTIDQITYMAGAIRSFFAPQKSYAELNSTSNAGLNLIKKAQLVPDEMWEDGKKYPQSVWGSGVGIVHVCRNQAERNNGIFKAFGFVYGYIPEEACIDLLSQDLTNAGVNVISIRTCVDECTPDDEDLYAVHPLDLETAVKFCSLAAYPSSGLVMDVSFYFDVDVNDSLWKGDIDATTALLSGS